MRKYIDADEFVKEMNDRIDAAIKWGVNAIAERNEEIKTRAEQAVATFCEASLTAKKMPAADVHEVRHGRWEWNKRLGEWYCSNCGRIMTPYTVEKSEGEYKMVQPNYCGWCGAKMDEVSE